MSLTTPLLYIIIFIVLLYIFTDVFSLLIYRILLAYVFINYDIFFTDTMSASLLGILQLITGTIALGSFVKMIVIASNKKGELFQ